MSDEKENQEQAQNPAKKKLTALIGVVVGAVLGGAGVVVMTPAHVPKLEPEHAVPQEVIEWYAKDVELDFRFNPQTATGKAFAQIGFTIGYLVQPGKLEEAKASVEARLGPAKSLCLELLTAQSVAELRSVDGKKHLKRLLIDELTYSLFPGTKDQRIAKVENIFWTRFLIQ